MIDPVAGAIASAVAQQSAEKVRELIEQSESPEEAWKKSCYEVAIKIRTSYEQNQGVETNNNDRFSRDMEGYGHMARELAVYGGIKDFDDEMKGKMEELADGCAETARSYSGIPGMLEAMYSNKNIPSILDYILEHADSG